MIAKMVEMKHMITKLIIGCCLEGYENQKDQSSQEKRNQDWT